MNSNIDVLKELEVKNKEIYINKLNIDLDTNLENLLITINNIIELLKDEFISKISEITKNDDNNHDVVAFQNLIQERIIDLINKRTTILKDNITNIDNIDYKEVLNNATSELFNNAQNLYKENINPLIEKLNKGLDDFQKERLSEYLNIIFYEKLMNKFKGVVNNLDVILYNNYQESYQKYLTLKEKNEKTLK